MAAFRARIAYDSSRLEFRGVQAEGETGEKDFRFSKKQDSVIVVYMSEGTGVSIDGAVKELLTLKFLVKEDAVNGQAEVKLDLDGVGSDQLRDLQADGSVQGAVSVAAPDYSLAALQPDVGSLSPSFQPEITEYTLEVAGTVDRVTFYAIAANEAASVKVSRKTLEKAGESTLIQITVRGQDGKVKKTYEVTVSRGIKAGPLGSSPGARASGNTKAPASSKRSSKPAWVDIDPEESEASSSDAAGESWYTAGRQEPRAGLLQKDNTMGAFLIGTAACLVIAAALVVVKKTAGHSKKQTGGMKDRRKRK